MVRADRNVNKCQSSVGSVGDVTLNKASYLQSVIDDQAYLRNRDTCFTDYVLAKQGVPARYE